MKTTHEMTRTEQRTRYGMPVKHYTVTAADGTAHTGDDLGALLRGFPGWLGFTSTTTREGMGR